VIGVIDPGFGRACFQCLVLQYDELLPNVLTFQFQLAPLQLGWQAGAAMTAAARVAAAGGWLAERVAISRYAHIPVGNLVGVVQLEHNPG